MLTNRPYWLQTHVHLCVVESGVILLDLRRDKYFGIDRRSVRALAGAVVDWPRWDEVPTDSAPISDFETIERANLLVQAGLLTLDPAAGKSASPLSFDLSGTMQAIGRNSPPRQLARAGDIANFLIASSTAACALRWRSLEAIVDLVSERKNRALHGIPEFDTSRAADLVNMFRRLRCYAFTARGKCLFHALALINFLAHYDLYPQWVIGVKTSPWGAHSWVQEGNFVLDETPERVRFYTPILAI